MTINLQDSFKKGISRGRHNFVSMDHKQVGTEQSLHVRKLADKDLRLVGELATALANVNDNRGFPIAAKTKVLHPKKEVLCEIQSGQPKSISVHKGKDGALSITEKFRGTTTNKQIDDVETALKLVAEWAGEVAPHYETPIKDAIEKFEYNLALRL